MNINAYDLIVLHKNVNRIEGREIFSNNTLANNDKDVLSSIEKLIKEDILIKTNQFEISIQKKKLTELREILKENKFKTTGTKQVLIDLIRDNFNNIANLELPYVYVATNKGEITLKDTEYLLTFISDGISLHRAYHIAENYLDEDCVDKVVRNMNFKIYN
ncbi:SAP domain-containing protein [Staphylococcus aureus]|uniref:SAP domain-containing protein n=1 Tax=Staphylococcus aureus TaxID=1280 RepID=UPI0012446AEA|nr:SAP domain-containing protein [Staphylococcus aureus]